MAEVSTTSVKTSGLLHKLAFGAATVFSGCLVFGESLGSIPLMAATLFSLSLGFLLQSLGY